MRSPGLKRARPTLAAPLGYMYIVQRGIALYNGRVLTKGKTWGDDMIIRSDDLRLRATCAAFTPSYHRCRFCNHVSGMTTTNHDY